MSLEKASIFFNMAALYSQIGTRSDRQTITGLEEAIASFQIAAGRETIHLSHTSLTPPEQLDDGVGVQPSQKVTNDSFSQKELIKMDHRRM